ncbi:hypothetical protein [Aureibacter tunicatorum]|uniref:Small nuclear ribonucleoprotein (SnRNP)-like protein n=1 Tax=Aureibacter tunicatorum TaxID=866807 RepID=A0AAE3XLJ8_9BACT|nr:hypothetical protein [Aureibacter tunicatorum]MDR6238238.1 small nuclear ribonucleoprotein (snRNP)-like protein [Aureibacter tunicatorum]BDD03271.1 hypothetical protein AUTU_07540 [Aureibacter tunicatorum]
MRGIFKILVLTVLAFACKSTQQSAGTLESNQSEKQEKQETEEGMVFLELYLKMESQTVAAELKSVKTSKGRLKGFQPWEKVLDGEYGVEVYDEKGSTVANLCLENPLEVYVEAPHPDGHFKRVLVKKDSTNIWLRLPTTIQPHALMIYRKTRQGDKRPVLERTILKMDY